MKAECREGDPVHTVRPLRVSTSLTCPQTSSASEVTPSSAFAYVDSTGLVSGLGLKGRAFAFQTTIKAPRTRFLIAVWKIRTLLQPIENNHHRLSLIAEILPPQTGARSSTPGTPPRVRRVQFPSQTVSREPLNRGGGEPPAWGNQQSEKGQPGGSRGRFLALLGATLGSSRAPQSPSFFGFSYFPPRSPSVPTVESIRGAAAAPESFLSEAFAMRFFLGSENSRQISDRHHRNRRHFEARLTRDSSGQRFIGRLRNSKSDSRGSVPLNPKTPLSRSVRRITRNLRRSPLRPQTACVVALAPMRICFNPPR